MKRTVYIETSIPSFLYDTRTSPAAIARRESTRKWWDEESRYYELYTSVVVLAELRKGEFPGKDQAIQLIEKLPKLEIVHEIEDLVDIYAQHKLMPAQNRNDAYHLAIASHYSVHFLLTWNCRHLANVNKVEHLTRINHRIGLYVPRLTTPDLFFHEEREE